MDFEGRQSRLATIVLHNPELLERILQHLRGYPKTLVSASLTTRAFSEPAFNVLWYTMYSLWPLFRILPTFGRGTGGEYVFTGPVRTEHLQRVLYYAKRIRFLDYQDEDDGLYCMRNLMISTFMRMDRLGAFIPLRRIRLQDPYATIPFPLTSPNLDKIEIYTQQTPPKLTEIEVAFFLQSVASQSPSLRCLVINGPWRGIILQVLPDFINLHSLTIFLKNSDIPTHFLKQLAESMSSLQHLRIYIATCRFTPQRPEQSHSVFRPSFPSLETLKVGIGSTHLESLIGVLDAPLLKSVSLSVVQSTPDHDPIMHKFVERNGHLKDKVYSLIIKTVVDPSLSFVKCFENSKSLRVFSSHGTISMSLIADTFSDDGSTWFHSLAHLHLNQSNPNNPFDCMSTAALRFIADACPNLISLEISIYRPDEPEKQRVVKKEGKPHDLKNLIFLNLPAVWDDTIALAVEFVSLLEYLFPSMAVPKYIGGITDKPGSLATREAWWKGVGDMWKMCQSIKNQKE